jgi:hypothetical protein
MKTDRQDGHDPHREFMEWVAAVEAACPQCAVDRERRSDDKPKITPAA